MKVILVTMPTDLAAWYAAQASKTGSTTNDIMVKALAEYRRRVEISELEQASEPDHLVESPFGGGY